VQSGGDLQVALDVARAARRLGATQEVRCLVVEDRTEMLADPIEIAEAEEEGIVIENHFAPKRIIGADGRAIGVETLSVARTFDDRGRFNPELIPGTEKIWDCDSVIVSIGQTGELTWVKPEDGVDVTPRGTLTVSRETLMTTAPGIFAGGDIAFGPRLIINAVADGQRAARGIHGYLQNVQPRLVRKGFFTALSKREYPDIGPLRNYLRWPRRNPPVQPIERRVGVAVVENRYSAAAAREQGGRCLICSINPVFDGDLCILCNGCVDVCPTDCLKLVSKTAVTGDSFTAAVIEQHTQGSAQASVMLLDPTRCIRCGLCAARCPTDAVRMESFRFTHEIQFVEGV
jgi:formate dehydrogenase beta subunit